MKNLIIMLVLQSCLIFVASMRKVVFKTCKNRKLISTLLDQKKAISETGCAADCFAQGECNSANFDEHTDVCELFTENVSHQTCDAFPTSSSTTLLMMVSPCKNNQPFNGTDCICHANLTGQFCENGRRDCDGIPYQEANWYDIYPDDGLGKVRVYCAASQVVAFVAPTSGFTPEFLNGSWSMFKNGFGHLTLDKIIPEGSYWLGNDNIHRITNGTADYKLQYYCLVPATQVGNYNAFSVDSESDNYTVHYKNYSTGMTMAQTLPDGGQFRTFDRNDNGCAVQANTGFWFTNGCSDEPPILGFIKLGNTSYPYVHFLAFLIRI